MIFNKMFYSSDFGYLNGSWGGLLIILLIWGLFWKGMALWKSARSGDKVWFIVFLLANTLGILEILYIYLFSKKEKVKKKR